MRLAQRVLIPRPNDEVWASLNDPDILKQCLPGCETFDAVEDNVFQMVVLAKVGPVKARFSGEVSLSDMDPPLSYTLNGEGKGGVAGFARGSASVRLEPLLIEGVTVTRMTYSVDAKVGGKLAQLGARLVGGAARKMADQFFTSFVRVICNDPDGTLEITLETVEEA